MTVGLGGFVTASASPGSPSTFVPVSPCRLVDTRVNVQGTTALGGDKTMTVAAHGSNGACVLPNEAQALTMNVTAVQGSALSYLTVYPADEGQPLASSLNWDPGTYALANQVTVPLSATGEFKVYNNAGTVHVVVDVVGYFVTSGGVAAQGVKGERGDKGDKGDKGDTAAVVYSGPHWGLIDRNTIGSPVGALRSGPYEGTSTPPLGVGSLGFSVKDGNEKVAFGNEVDFFGQTVNAITAIGFQVFWTGEDKGIGADNLPNITLEVDPMGAAGLTGPHYSSMVFVPFGAPLTTNTFNAIDATSTAAGWWYFTNAATAAATHCGQVAPLCSFTDLKAAIGVELSEHVRHQLGRWQGQGLGVERGDRRAAIQRIRLRLRAVRGLHLDAVGPHLITTKGLGCGRDPWSPPSHVDGHLKKRRRNDGRCVVRALVVCVEEGVELSMELVGATARFGGSERVHRRAVVAPERVEELRW